MQENLHGHYETVVTDGAKVEAFIPPPLLSKPTIEWATELLEKFDEAEYALECLDASTKLYPTRALLPFVLVRKEAFFSSKIEGCFTEMLEVLRLEENIEVKLPWEGTEPVVNLARATEYGLRRLREGFPLSLRLLRETHSILFWGKQGKHLIPGDFRRGQVWLGGRRPEDAEFVPPPADHVLDCMGDLEQFLRGQSESGWEEDSPLLKVAIAHVQFVTIHPFCDGNGRLGRLLITLLLQDANLLRQPLLCLSLYFLVRSNLYRELLISVRETGDWTQWLDFFADAVIVMAEWAQKAAQRAYVSVETKRQEIRGMDEGAQSTLQVFEALLDRPIARVPWLVAETDRAEQTVRRALDRLMRRELIQEGSDCDHDRVYIAGELRDLAFELNDENEVTRALSDSQEEDG